MNLNLNLENLLEEALDRRLKEDGLTPSNLEESIRYSLLSPGKRIRPRLLLASADMFGISTSGALPAALAIEMVHCFTLIHDDLPSMDDDDFRRGIPSNHKKFGEGLALLAGDALLALGIEVFLDTQIEPPYLLSGLKRFLSAIGPRGVIGGQASESLLGKDSTIADLQKMHSQKTGALFSASLLIPKDFAGVSDESPPGRAISDFAHELGLAFQIADDIEDGQTENQKATSVLFYLSLENARSITLQGLHSSMENLIRHWGKKASELEKIANEIIQKIERA